MEAKGWRNTRKGHEPRKALGTKKKKKEEEEEDEEDEEGKEIDCPLKTPKGMLA